jgi:protease-4
MRIILFLLKCVVGFLASIGVLVILAGVLLGFGYQRVAELRAPAAEIPENAILTLDLTNGVQERPSVSPFRLAADGNPVPLHDAVDALEAAAGDDRIEAVAVRLGRGSLGLAQAQELRAAIRRFRDSDKPAFAFAETLSSGMGGGTVHAYLSSAFDRVWMQPSGTYGLLGFRTETPFLRGLLEDIGVVPQLAQREAYKGAANQFKDRDMPEPQRENLNGVLTSWLDTVVAAVAGGRGLPERDVRALLERAPLSAEDALDAGLVDTLGYRSEMEDALTKVVGGAAETVALAAYGAQRERPPEDAPRVAVIHGLGAVALAESQYDPGFGTVVMGSDTVAPAIREALDDDSVAAIVFRVDSPGGSYVASDAIWHAVQAARDADKPFVVSMGNLAASGGYFVSAPANHIVASPGTLTGSIGVVTGKFVLVDVWPQISVTVAGVEAGPRAGYWSPNEPFSDAEWAHLQNEIDASYGDFVAKVAEGRGLDRAAVAEAAQGKVWSGRDAKAQGLVDELGGFHTAVQRAKALAGIAADQPVRKTVFPKPEDPLRKFLSQALEGRIDSPAARALARLNDTLRPLVDLVAMLEGRRDTPRRLEAAPAAQRAADPAR